MTKTGLFARHLARADWLVACAFPHPSLIVPHARRPVDHHQSNPILKISPSLRSLSRTKPTGNRPSWFPQGPYEERLVDLEVPEEASENAN